MRRPPRLRASATRHRRAGRVTRAWTLAWLGGAGIGVANGVARDATYGKHVADAAARQISVLTAIAAFAVYFRMLERRWPIGDRNQALAIGSIWLALTMCFEFAFGRLVAKKPWPELLGDYNVMRGRLWPLVLLWLWAGPEITRREHTSG